MHDEILLQFLQGRGPDTHGRYHSDILHFSDEELENEHDYIQWLFPLREESQAVPGSPFLENEEIIKILQNDPDVQNNLKRAVTRMEIFYRENDNWLQRDNHNHLRITRILRSVGLISSKEKAKDFYAYIMQLVEAVQPVSNKSLDFWKKTISD